MASFTSAARLPEPADFDYSVSHRAAPTPPTSRKPPQHIGEKGRQSRDDLSRAGSTARRRSLDRLLHHSRNPSRGTTPIDAPPVPNTRIAQAHHAQAASSDSNGEILSLFPAVGTGTSSNNDQNNNASTMLRKLSSGRHEQDRVAREAAVAAARQHQTPRQAPRLPSINDFHDDARPDSLAIFNHQYGSHATHPPPAPATTANFSRPGVAAAMPSSGYNSSSSPAYALKTGNAFAQQAASSSSPASGAKSADGEAATANSMDRAESMAHRGRYSYASTNSPAAAHVNSPRRVRRRKDPTPFK